MKLTNIYLGLGIFGAVLATPARNEILSATSATGLDELPATLTAGLQGYLAHLFDHKDLRREATPTAPSLSDPTNAGGPISVANSFTSLASSNATSTSSAAESTSIAVFTANGAQYTATAISSVVMLAGYQMSAGGPDELVGGVAVTVAKSGLVEDGQTVMFHPFTPSSTVVAAVSTTSSSSSGTQTTMMSSTSAAAASSGSASGSAAAASTASSAAAASVPTKNAVAALGGIAGLFFLVG